MKKYKALLFDFDGTLVDSMPSYCAVMLRILNESGIPYREDIIKIITPLGYAGAAKHFIGLGMERTEEDLVAQMHAYALAAYRDSIPAKPCVVDALRRLKAMGYSLNVLTASPHEMLDVCLERIGIFDWFDHVWSCEDFGTTKSDPAIYAMAAEKTGFPIEEILFLDDNYNADACAKTTGIGVCGVYDDSSAEFEQEIRDVADFYVRDFGELAERIAGTSPTL